MCHQLFYKLCSQWSYTTQTVYFKCSKAAWIFPIENYITCLLLLVRGFYSNPFLLSMVLHKNCPYHLFFALLSYLFMDGNWPFFCKYRFSLTNDKWWAINVWQAQLISMVLYFGDCQWLFLCIDSSLLSFLFCSGGFAEIYRL